MVISSYQLNTELVGQRFKKALKTYDFNAIVQTQMAKKLVSLAMPFCSTDLLRVFEIGCGTGLLTKQIIKYFNITSFIANDLVSEVYPIVNSIVENTNQNTSFRFLKGDINQINFPTKTDIIFSGATIQWIEDLDRFFSESAISLNNNGILAISTFGTDNFNEIRTILNQGLDYRSLDQFRLKSSRWFNVLIMEEWKETMLFDTPIDVLKHIKTTGVGGVSVQRWNKKRLEKFVSGYEQFKTPDNKYPLTYHPQIMIFKR
ncbi:MAG: malonyl-ACP O-methyltransferase BioC [Marinilabiliaceae bacterium]|nr:malonyl-ACP O-methyltransferase BioC [Marinilabiliaceae bacterium]